MSFMKWVYQYLGILAFPANSSLIGSIGVENQNLFVLYDNGIPQSACNIELFPPPFAPTRTVKGNLNSTFVNGLIFLKFGKVAS